jgi:hypothetical protein
MSGQRHAPAVLCPREWTHVTYWIGIWVGLKADLDTEARRKIVYTESYIFVEPNIILVGNNAYKIRFDNRKQHGVVAYGLFTYVFIF